MKQIFCPCNTFCAQNIKQFLQVSIPSVHFNTQWWN